MALIEPLELTALQKRLVKYWLLAFLALIGSMLVAMAVTVATSFAFGIDYYRGNNDRDITLATVALTILIWIPSLIWARRRSRCLQCQRSLLPLWWHISYDFGERRWVNTIPPSCPSCGDTS